MRAMTMLRGYGGSLMLVCLISQFAHDGRAQNYPAKPIRYIVSGSPGSGTDTLGRIMAERLGQVLGQQAVVENHAGGGSNIAAEMVARAPADGHTILQTTITLAVNVTLYRKLNYDLVRDFLPVTRLATGPYIFLVHPSLPVKSIVDMIKLAKAKPGAIDYSSGGTGTATFLAAELFKGQAGVNLTHIPYKGGGPALTAVISGEVPVHVAPVATGIPPMKQGSVRALGVSSSKRLSLVPDIPTIAEAGVPGYETGNWYGLMVPAKTPRETAAIIRNAAIKILNTPDVNKRLVDLGYVVIGDQTEEFAPYIKLEIDRLGKIIRAFNLTAD